MKFFLTILANCISIFSGVFVLILCFQKYIQIKNLSKSIISDKDKKNKLNNIIKYKKIIIYIIIINICNFVLSGNSFSFFIPAASIILYFNIIIDIFEKVNEYIKEKDSYDIANEYEKYLSDEIRKKKIKRVLSEK